MGANHLVDSGNMQFGHPTSAQRYLKYFQPLKIIVLLEKSQVSAKWQNHKQ